MFFFCKNEIALANFHITSVKAKVFTYVACSFKLFYPTSEVINLNIYSCFEYRFGYIFDQGYIYRFLCRAMHLRAAVTVILDSSITSSRWIISYFKVFFRKLTPIYFIFLTDKGFFNFVLRQVPFTDQVASTVRLLFHSNVGRPVLFEILN